MKTQEQIVDEYVRRMSELGQKILDDARNATNENEKADRSASAFIAKEIINLMLHLLVGMGYGKAEAAERGNKIGLDALDQVRQGLEPPMEAMRELKEIGVPVTEAAQFMKMAQARIIYK